MRYHAARCPCAATVQIFICNTAAGHVFEHVLEGLMPKDRSKASPAKCVAAAEVKNKEEFFEGLGNIAEAPRYFAPHASRLTLHASRLMPHASLLTPHALHFTPHALHFTPQVSRLTLYASGLTPHAVRLTPDA